MLEFFNRVNRSLQEKIIAIVACRLVEENPNFYDLGEKVHRIVMRKKK